MKKLILSFITFAVITVSNTVLAEGKIAVVNLDAAMLNTEVAQQRIKKLGDSADIADLKAKLETIEADLKKMTEDREKNGLTWDQAKQLDFQKKGENLVSDRKGVIEKIQREEAVLKQSLAQELGPKLQKALKELIEAEGLGLVLNTQTVLYAEDSYNITGKLTDRMNKMK